MENPESSIVRPKRSENPELKAIRGKERQFVSDGDYKSASKCRNDYLAEIKAEDNREIRDLTKKFDHDAQELRRIHREEMDRHDQRMAE